MTWTELLNQIKTEGLIDATTDYDELVLGIANQTMINACRRQDYQQYYRVDQELELEAGDAFTPLPSEFLRLDSSDPRIRYVGSQNEWFIRLSNARTARSLDGTRVHSFRIANGAIYFYPFAEAVIDGDKVILNYFARPELIEEGADEVPEIFEDLIRHSCLARILNLKDSKRAQLHLAMAKDTFVNTVASNGASN